MGRIEYAQVIMLVFITIFYDSVHRDNWIVQRALFIKFHRNTVNQWTVPHMLYKVNHWLIRALFRASNTVCKVTSSTITILSLDFEPEPIETCLFFTPITCLQDGGIISIVQKNTALCPKENKHSFKKEVTSSLFVYIKTAIHRISADIHLGLWLVLIIWIFRKK